MDKLSPLHPAVQRTHWKGMQLLYILEQYKGACFSDKIDLMLLLLLLLTVFLFLLFTLVDLALDHEHSVNSQLSKRLRIVLPDSLLLTLLRKACDILLIDFLSFFLSFLAAFCCVYL